MSDDFTRDLFGWLNAVLAHPQTGPFTFMVAFALSQHVNRASGEAWPSQDRLAELVAGSSRGVRNALHELRAAGFLEVESGGGRHVVNRYRLAGVRPETRNDGAWYPDKPGTVVPSNPADTRNGGSGFEQQNPERDDTKPGTVVPPEPSEEPSEERDRSLALSPNLPAVVEPSSKRIARSEPEGFDEWYAAYPRHKKRGDAAKAYRSALKAGKIACEPLLTRTVAYAASRAGQDPKYTPYPASWLNAEGWLDEPDAPSPLTINGRRSWSALDQGLTDIEP